MSTLRAAVSAGESGPLIILSGETDIATVAELSELVTAQLAGGAVHLTIDVSGLSFADSASVRVLVLAARTLQERDGGLVLLRPQHGGGQDAGDHRRGQMIAVRGDTGVTSEPRRTSP